MDSAGCGYLHLCAKIINKEERAMPCKERAGEDKREVAGVKKCRSEMIQMQYPYIKVSSNIKVKNAKPKLKALWGVVILIIACLFLRL